MMHLVPSRKTDTAPDFARMFVSNVVRLHGLPDSIISDRGSLFTSQFWTALSKLLGVKHRLSTSFHPQTDGQTERLNQVIEQYLRIFCNYQQDNWHSLLPLAEFAYNNSFQSTIKTSPFYANYGYHPRFTFTTTTPSPLDVPAAKELADKLAAHHDALSENIKFAQDSQARYYDSKHQRVEFNVGDKAWLLSTNVHTERPSKKLDWKRLGPYTILERIGLQAYRLQLPNSMKIHNVFHVSLLEKYTPSKIPNRKQPPPPPVVVPSTGTWYEVQEILDSCYRRRSLYYKIRWKGYDLSEDSWQLYSDVNSPEHVRNFHSRYPSKSGPSPHPPPRR
jgi:transposase InsO family protein